MEAVQRAVKIDSIPAIETGLSQCTLEDQAKKSQSVIVERSSFTEQKQRCKIEDDSDVLVRLRCRPVNSADIWAMQGRNMAFTKKRPATPGEEGMGTVEATGSKVTSCKVGDRVVPILNEYFLQGEGSWQEFVKVDEGTILKVPSEISDEVAAQALINPWTVLGILDTLQVPKGEYVLQAAAGLALGQQFIQYARHKAIKTINLIRKRSEKLEAELKALGADEIIAFEEEDTQGRVMEITGGKGVYAAIDPVGRTMSGLLGKCVRKHGTVLLYGNLGGPDVTVQAADMLYRDIRFFGFSLSLWLEEKYKSRESRLDLGKLAMELLRVGIMLPPIGKTFDLSEYKAAIDETYKPGQHTKLLLIG